MAKAVCVKVNMRSDVVDKIKRLAISKDKTFTATLSQLLDLSLFLHDRQECGDRVLLKSKEGFFEVTRQTS